MKHCKRKIINDFGIMIGGEKNAKYENIMKYKLTLNFTFSFLKHLFLTLLKKVDENIMYFTWQTNIKQISHN